MTELRWADDKVRKAYDNLMNSAFKDLHKHLKRAFSDLKQNPACGVSVQKKLIPNIYKKKYGVKSLFKYDLPGGWRLMYSVDKDGIDVIAIILEWLCHKDYEKRFGYTAR